MIAALVTGLTSPATAAERIVNVYNWADYISEDALRSFEQETGIKVNYDVFDSLETLEGKILVGSSGYDVIFPNGPLLEKFSQLNLLAPLDHAKVPGWSTLDANVLDYMAKYDAGNKHGAPYMWGTIGIGYDVDAIERRMPGAPVDSLDILFKPEIAQKFADCGIGVLDSPSEVLVMALNYLGLDPYSADEAAMEKARQLLMSVRPHIRYFRNVGFAQDLATGDICLMLGYSADIYVAKKTAVANQTGITVGLTVPKEGSIVFFDSMAILADGQHKEEAYAFINYILRPEVIAELSNNASVANAVPAATPLVDEQLRSNVGIYPPADRISHLIVDKTVNAETTRLRTRVWTRIKTSQ